MSLSFSLCMVEKNFGLWTVVVGRGSFEYEGGVVGCLIIGLCDIWKNLYCRRGDRGRGLGGNVVVFLVFGLRSIEKSFSLCAEALGCRSFE